MICRKDSLGYVDFLRGKYSLYDTNYLQNLINEMTLEEKKRILTCDFHDLWNNLWGVSQPRQYHDESRDSFEKFQEIKGKLKKLVAASTTNWVFPEWGFPKGRRNYQENDLICALREFQEETGYIKTNLRIIRNLMPFEEIFLGSNMKSYKHKYFLAFMDAKINNSTNFQKSEVSQMGWFTLDECYNKIRPYNLEKKEVLKNIDKVLHRYRFII